MRPTESNQQNASSRRSHRTHRTPSNLQLLSPKHLSWIACLLALSAHSGFAQMTPATADSDLQSTKRPKVPQLNNAGATLSVGSGKACDYANLHQAITEAPSNSLMEVQGGAVFLGTEDDPGSAFRIISKSLSILGGYSPNCNGSRNEQLTVLSISTEGQRVLEVTGVGGPFFLDLVDVELVGGDHPAIGGGLLVDNNTSVGLFNSRVSFNDAPFGGGIGLLGGNGASVLLFDTDIDKNDAILGGGMFCQDATVLLAGASFDSNDASADGGALFIDSCQIETLPGSVDNTWAFNTAERGGAIAATGVTDVDLISSAQSRHVLRKNQATEDGGAAYAADGAVLRFFGVELRDNEATRGGGVFLEESAQARLRGQSPEGTPRICSHAPCTTWEGNLATQGGLAYLDGEAFLTLEHGVGRGNGAAFGSLLWITEMASATVISSSIAATSSGVPGGIRGIGGPALFEVQGGLTAIHLTAANNPEMEVSFRLDTDARLTLLNSIVWQPGAGSSVYQELGPPDSTFVLCNIVHESASLPLGHSETSTQNPLLVLTDSLHLEAESPAIDLCPLLNGFPLDFDLELRDANPDAGADEYRGVFFDNFETGDTSRWSAAERGAGDPNVAEFGTSVAIWGPWIRSSVLREFSPTVAR